MTTSTRGSGGDDDDDVEPKDNAAPSTLSASAMESIKSILHAPPSSSSSSSLHDTAFASSHADRSSTVKLSWSNGKDPNDSNNNDNDEDVVEIVEEVPSLPPSRPIKGNAWRHTRTRQPPPAHGGNDPRGNGKASSSSSSSSSSSHIVPKPPKSTTNLSLLSSTVAHATLERCLLGVNGGGLFSHHGSESCTDNVNHAPPPPPSVVNYSKQCRPGHVIDLLELRRLSSRGIPDEPPEVRLSRHRAASAPERAAMDDDDDDGEDVSRPAYSEHSGGGSAHLNSHNHTPSSSSAAGNRPSSRGENPHRSYRPLVWRVLLGYLPPETDQWNEVLTRDRKLYANFVREMFRSTCPAPHEEGEEGVRTQRQMMEEEEEGQEEGVMRGEAVLGGNRVYRSDGMGSEGNGPPVTPGGEDGPSSSSSSSRGDAATSPLPLTPGLLSARMQQEWVRGEESVFRTPSGRSLAGDEDGNHVTANSRISPLCAMNTPRVRSRKQPPPSSNVNTIREEKDEDILNSKSSSGTGECPSTGLTECMTQSSINEGEREMMGMMNALLLPDDLEEVGGTTKEAESSEEDGGRKMTRTISITTTTDSGKEEAVELCRNGSNDDEKGKLFISSSPSMDLDEEENIQLLDEIRKDVIRTHPDLRFFLEPKDDLGQKRYAALERILFVWAKLNKGVRYVQGMNEIVGTLYFVLAHDSNEDWAKEAEADTYFLFNALMVEMRDVFVPDLDEADTGIHGRISNMITLLALHDPEVRCHLDSVGIDPSFYSVRWLTTLLSREFLLPDTIRLWDSMLASTHKDNFLRYVSVTMVMVIRNQLLRGDFSTCLRLLQAYPPTNLDRLLESSRALWIYESQITLACHKGGISLGHALRSICPPPAIIMAYGLHGGIAPPIRDQVRQAGERGLAAARGAANGASHSVANAGRSFLGNAMEYWRSGSSVSKQKKDMQRAKSMT